MNSTESWAAPVPTSVCTDCKRSTSLWLLVLLIYSLRHQASRVRYGLTAQGAAHRTHAVSMQNRSAFLREPAARTAKGRTASLSCTWKTGSGVKGPIAVHIPEHKDCAIKSCAFLNVATNQWVEKEGTCCLKTNCSYLVKPRSSKQQLSTRE